MAQEEQIKKQYNLEKQNEETIDMLIDQITIHIDEEKLLMDFMQKIREYRSRIYELKLQLGSYLTKAYQEKNTIELQDLRKRMNRVKKQTSKTSITCFFIEDNIAKESMQNIFKIGLETGEYPLQVMARRCSILKETKEENRLLIKENNETQSYEFYNEDGSKKLLRGLNEYWYQLINSKKLEDLIEGNQVVINNENINNEFKDLEKASIKKINTFNMRIVFSYYEKELKFWEEINLNKIGEFTQEEQCLE